MNFHVPGKAEFFFGSWETIGFSKRPLVHEIGYTSNKIRLAQVCSNALHTVLNAVSAILYIPSDFVHLMKRDKFIVS
jgi:hypothetical protein